ncbi:hypothetical protein HMPREF9999_01126 [Alloprevotella sp. oral taxon 473 str. F0040]|nr:hypothetical protein HMPREF9999_01126 [Alloprevotella sp. oral taxon 473 str. F0040]
MWDRLYAFRCESLIVASKVTNFSSLLSSISRFFFEALKDYFRGWFVIF